MNKVAILIVNYNMPERTDALCRHIAEKVRWPHDLVVIDNGSDLVKPSKYTKLWLPKNRQTTGGWLAGLRYATEFENYFAYWFLITSAEFPVEGGDPLSPLAQFLVDHPEAVGVHPALTEDSTTAWKHLLTRGGSGCRRTWMIDNIASLYRADWFDGIGRFDPELTYAWGIDFETCWKARQAGRSLWVCEDTRIQKVTNIGYTMNRMQMTAEERCQQAGSNMDAVMRAKYGRTWRQKMENEFIEESWR